MGLVVLDASVVIGFLDPDDAHHSSAVEALDNAQTHNLILPASAYAEILVGPFRAGPDAVNKVNALLEDLAIEIEPLDAEIAEAAASLRARYPALRLPDALVLATGKLLEAVSTITADAEWARVDKRVTTI